MWPKRKNDYSDVGISGSYRRLFFLVWETFNAMRSISISVIRHKVFFKLFNFLYVRIESCYFVSWIAMISGTANRKIFVQTRDENIKTELVPFVFRSSVGVSVRIQEVRKKDDFRCSLFFSTFELIQMKTATKVSR